MPWGRMCIQPWLDVVVYKYQLDKVLGRSQVTYVFTDVCLCVLPVGERSDASQLKLWGYLFPHPVHLKVSNALLLTIRTYLMWVLLMNYYSDD